MTNEKPSENKSLVLTGAFLGILSSLTLIGLLSLGDSLFGFPFVPFDIFDWMARSLPGWLIGTVISTMVAAIRFFQGFFPIGDISTTAKLAEQAIALVQLVAGGAVFGALLGWQARKPKRDLVLFGQIGGLFLLAVTLFVEISLGSAQLSAFAAVWLALLFVGWGWGLAWLIQRFPQTEAPASPPRLSRRQFLAVSGAGLAAAALGAWGFGKIFGGSGLPAAANQATPQPVSSGDPFGAALTSGPAVSPSPQDLAARPAPVNGTRPELTSNEDFYRIDINTRPPQVDESVWRLQVNGLVDNPLQMSLQDLRNMPPQTQILTMQCISNPIGGDLTSSSRWTGLRFADLLALAGVKAGAAGAYITSTDGFYEFVTREDIQDERCLLVYEMNGEPLPSEHGFPLRVYIPNRYGMKQPKWIENIELVAERVDGYWVDRGWDREAYVNTVSVVDTVVVDPDQGTAGMALCGGIAWASAKGISKVEVRVDDGSWNEAELISPPLSPLNWQLWRYAFPYSAGRHTLQVRAYDGNDELQVIENRPTSPSGATGIHSATVNL
ncbi:MAG TPA: molybdopterin-dependent oxidoreductase [Anaerolineales bacterium]